MTHHRGATSAGIVIAAVIARLANTHHQRIARGIAGSVFLINAFA